MNRILDALRTPVAMLLALVLALVAQLEHTAQVFMQVVDAHGIYAQVHAYAFAVAVETAVLLFVLAGHRRISYGFAIATALTNLSYYAMQGVDLLSVQGAPAWLMSLLLPAAIVGYSHTIADAPQQEKPPKPATTNIQPVEPAKAPVARPVCPLGHSSETPPDAAPAETGDLSATPAEQPQDGGGDKLTPAQRRAQIASAGLQTPEEVIAMFGVGKRTADGDLAWVRKNLLQTNGTGAHQ